MRKRIIIVAFVSAAAIAVAFFHGGAATSAKCGDTARPEIAKDGAYLVSGPGLVEPRSEVLQLGVELSGKIESFTVGEGDTVAQGQILAELGREDKEAEVAAAEALLEGKEALLLALVNGTREEEKAEARALVEEARVNVEYAQMQMRRQRQLFDRSVLSTRDLEVFERELKSTGAKRDAALQRLALLEAGARAEDIARAKADVLHAKALLAEARSQREKMLIRSPIDGVVLRRYHHVGEMVMAFVLTSDPLFAVGDLSRLRVRADIDEGDVAKIRTGQSAYVTAKAFPGKKFTGEVVKIGLQLGRKNVRTGEPQEFFDSRIIEVLIELDDGHELPIGLRVDAFILP